LLIDSIGRIGIGTTTPSKKLEIYHNDVTGGINLNRGSGTSSKSEIDFSKTGTELWAIGNDIDNNGHHTFFIWDNANGKSPFLINEEGKVSIGGWLVPTGGNQNYQLYVYGNIAARDLKVTINTFPDYIFANNYKPLTIYELENYIKLNKHLPGMPSAEEIKKNDGFEVGDMQQKLTKTVEEQALYIIQLQKQIDEMRGEIENLKK
jgi:hypothetical protein